MFEVLCMYASAASQKTVVRGTKHDNKKNIVIIILVTPTLPMQLVILIMPLLRAPSNGP